MKTWEITNHMRQVHKIRALLGDTSTPVDQIVKPAGMKTYLFNRRIAKLRQQEQAIDDKLTAGLIKYMNSKESKKDV